MWLVKKKARRLILASSECKPLLFEQLGAVAYITINRPHVANAFNDEVVSLGLDLISQLNKDDIKLIILRGEGKHFSAGADLNNMASMIDATLEENINDAEKLAKWLKELSLLNKPLLGIAKGSCFGGALGLLAVCDEVLAHEDSKFCFSEVKLGLVPAVISPYVINTIGPKKAKRYFLTAELFDAKQALELGFVDSCFNSQSYDGVLQKKINQYLSLPKGALSTVKKLVREVCTKQNDDILEYTARVIAKRRVSEEGQAGMRKFLNKQRSDNE